MEDILGEGLIFWVSNPIIISTSADGGARLLLPIILVFMSKTSSQTAEHAEVGGDMVLTGFSVVLVGQGNDPSIINPDFLYQNEIVDKKFSVVQRDQLITTPVFAQVIFDGGLTVRAEQGRMIFEQAMSPLAKETQSVQVARRYLEEAPSVAWKSIGINPKGFKPTPDTATEQQVLGALVERGKWASFKDVVPEASLKMVYRYEKRVINLDVGGAARQEEDGSTTPGIMFQANFHRDIQATKQQERVKNLLALLTSWESDLEDFYKLTKKFDFQKFGA